MVCYTELMKKQIGVGEAAFKESYSSLNSAQKLAVDTIEGPVMVVAGPGTGKTQILTLRIANILLKTDTPPDGVLALTFTESGAKAMRERLRTYIGSTAYRVPIYTFHGFAQVLINKYPDAYTKVIGGRPASDLEKISIIETIVNDGEVKQLRPMGNPSYYVTPIMRIISNLKQENVEPDDLVKIIDGQRESLKAIEQYHTKGAHKGKVRGEYSDLEKTIIKNDELVYIYRRYEALLSEQKLYDFDDMILETVKALEGSEDMLRDLQENYLYVLADEHQDVNGAQNRILELLTSFHDKPNIFAVGDEKQAIYRFQGASLENFLFFKEHFDGTEEIRLTENYRSGQEVLDAAHSLVESEDELLKDLRVPLMAMAVEKSVVESREFSHQSVEDEWLVDQIATKVEAGVKPEEIAVIVRTNREVEAFTQTLRKSGLAVTATAEGDILKHPITQTVHDLINVVVSGVTETALFNILHGAYWGISNDDLLRVLSSRSYQTSLASIISDEEKLTELKVVPGPFLRVHEVFDQARKKDAYEPPHRVLEYLVQASGYLEYLIEHDAFEGTRVIRRIYDEVEEMVRRDGVGQLRQVNEIFKSRLAYGLPLNAPYIATNSSAVQVMTAHKSKGLEFEVVFVPHVTDVGWSSANKRTMFKIPLVSHVEENEHEAIEDERRLLYVAMTRAKRELYISSAETSADGKQFTSSRLLDDIEEGLVRECDTSEIEDVFDPSLSLTKTTATVEVNSELLATLLRERGFSATSINNYLRSPWDYFYRNILRIPEMQPTHMQYGTAIHNTLEYATRRHTDTGTLPSDTEIKQRLENELGKLPLSTEEFTRLLGKGLEDLVVYKTHLNDSLPKNTKEELSIRVAMETGISEFPEVTLTGKLDRLDIGDDGRAIRVVDYKTGKPKTRNAIEGKTKNDDGGYKRQLVFYALLLSLYDDDRYRCREGVLSFVQANAKGQIQEESFVITDEEISELREEIISATKVIISGDFLTQPCDDTSSDYCHLVKQLLKR